MAVVIGEIVSEVTLTGSPAVAGPSTGTTGGVAGPPEEELVERVVRRATERVLEQLRRDWEA
ncbi:hypothetical protein GR925_24730 [Streptomyces sp. HUCO-GS316]|uniref:hypothetical protein n=1 Tax=Streptomyces sp. HUCO-GS316 TaxID=2692198 RepID=UPI0013684DE9|nr:hypothetical protein [Streptomyces sp. HUCO-GS316]MXM66543.1 hypothetical protein [Streptomyces sp. HUCO-GS316]